MDSGKLFIATFLLVALVAICYTKAEESNISSAEIQSFKEQVREWGIPPVKKFLEENRQTKGGRTTSQFVYESDNGQKCIVEVKDTEEGEKESEWSCDEEIATQKPKNEKEEGKEEEEDETTKKKKGNFGIFSIMRKMFGNLTGMKNSKKDEEEPAKSDESNMKEKDGEQEEPGMFGMVGKMFGILNKKKQNKEKKEKKKSGIFGSSPFDDIFG